MNDTLHLQTAFIVEDLKVLSRTDLTACSLLILTGAHSFSFALLDENHQQFIDLKSYYFPPDGNLLEHVERVFESDKILFTSFKSVKIAFDTPRQTLVPAHLYSPEIKKEYLCSMFGEAGDEAVFSDAVARADIVNVYSAGRNLAGYLKKEFPNARLYHAQTALLQAVVSGQWKREGHSVFLQVGQEQISVIVFSGSRLLYQRQLGYRKGLDIVYYVLNTLRRLELDPKEIPVLLAGNITEDSEVYQELYKFIEKLEWTDRPSALHYIEKFNIYPHHYFFNLFALGLCE